MLLTQIQAHEGLNLEESVELTSKISVVVGRNGSGKSRLLKAIVAGNIAVGNEDGRILPARIRHLESRLEAQFTSGYDPVTERDSRAEARTLYRALQGQFSNDPIESISTITQAGQGRSPMGRRGNILVPLAHAVRIASDFTGKDVNSLDDHDIEDFYSPMAGSQLGNLNVTALIRSYLARVEGNRFNKFKNKEYKTEIVTYSDEEFEARFGPQPWDVLNKFFEGGLGQRYYINEPSIADMDNYEAKLFRFDGRKISPHSLSSGGKDVALAIA